MAAGPGAWIQQRGGRYAVRWRLRSGDRGYRSFTTEAAAVEYRDAIRAQVAKERHGERTVSEAIAAYEREHLRARKGNRENSINQTTHRLRLFFAVDLDATLADLTDRHCAARYGDLADGTYERGGGRRRYSADYHRNVLSESRTFLEWCRARNWIGRNPLEKVTGVGRRRKGKPQLTIDEARKWDRAALAIVRKGEPGALAALLTVRLGLRASEIVGRKVRDLDDDGRLLRVTEAKTAKGVRVVEVSDDLRRSLAKLAKGRPGDDLLFGPHWRDWVRKWVAKICDAAGVPKVSAHGMRGLHATLAVQAGATSHLVAAALGHESVTTTEGNYARREAVEEAKRVRGMKVLKGGKR